MITTHHVALFKTFDEILQVRSKVKEIAEESWSPSGRKINALLENSSELISQYQYERENFMHILETSEKLSIKMAEILSKDPVLSMEFKQYADELGVILTPMPISGKE